MIQVFNYCVLTKDNTSLYGSVSFDSSQQAEQWIKNQGWEVIFIQEQSSWKGQVYNFWDKILNLFSDQEAQEAHLFFYYGSLLMKEGMNLQETLLWLDPLFPKKNIHQVLREIKRGSSLTVAFEHTSLIREKWILTFLILAQKNGAIESTFEKIASILGQRNKNNETLWSEIRKPLLYLIILMITGLLFLSIIAPLTESIFQEHNLSFDGFPFLIRSFFFIKKIKMQQIFMILLMVCGITLCYSTHQKLIFMIFLKKSPRSWHCWIFQNFYIDFFYKMTWLMDNGFLFFESLEALYPYIPEEHKDSFSKILYKIRNGFSIYESFRIYSTGLTPHHLLLLKNGEFNNCMSAMCHTILKLLEKDQSILMTRIMVLTPIFLLVIWMLFFLCLLSVLTPLFDVILSPTLGYHER
jgi:type II secretory pathway component PulF